MKNWAVGLAALACAASSCLAVDIVDNSGTARNGKVGYWSSLVAKGGQVGISYYCEDDTANSPPDLYVLRFAWVTEGHTWHWFTVDSNCGADTSMARGTDGFYQILYSTASGMGWAVGANSSWSVSYPPVPANVYPSNISMVLDRNDRPHVAYMNWANGGDHAIRYTRFNGVSWTTPEIVATNIWTPTIGFSNTYLALDSSGNPHITYALPSDPMNAYGDIRYATRTGSGWVHESLGTQGVDPCLRIGTDNVPRVAFTQGDDIAFAFKAGANWTFESLAADIPGMSGAASLTLALSAANIPFLSFEMGISEDMFIATRGASGWSASMIDGDGLPDGSLLLGRLGTGLDVDENGIPHTSYSALEFYSGGYWRTDLRYSGPGGGGPPPCVTITRSPAPVSICNGDPASFDVLASGTEALSYLWQWKPDASTTWIDTVEGVNLDPTTLLPAFVAIGHDTTTLDLPGAGITPDLSCSFRCFVSSTCGNATSQAATLSASSGAQIIAHPQDAYSCPKGPVFFSVAASGGSPAFQWQMQNPDTGDWLDILEGQNETPVFFIAGGVSSPGLQLSDFLDDDSPPHLFSGSLDLRCLVTSSCGQVASNSAELTVCPADFNCDAQVDFFDYLDFALAFSNEADSADFNLDGQIDFFDYLDFVQSFGAGC